MVAVRGREHAAPCVDAESRVTFRVHTRGWIMAGGTGVNISEITECNSAIVHGIFVGRVSPVKKSQKKTGVEYFETNLNDGKNTVRLVSFNLKMRKEVEDAYKNGREVAVASSCVKRNREDQFEILAHNRSSIGNSPKKFKFKDDATHMVKLTGNANICDLETIEEVKDLKEWQHVNVVGKVKFLSASEEVKGKGPGCMPLLKRDVTLADGTGVCRAVAWQEQIGKLSEDQ